MALTVAGRNAAATGVGGAITFASLHTADPAMTGANEITGGTPAYARQPITWTETNGVASLNGPVTFNVPPGTTVAYVGLWNAPNAGTYEGAAQLSAPETFTGQGTYTLTSLTVTVTSP
ncbi:MAG TPA: hypothetical protein VE326_11530 [Candidatus Binatia bacterium]|nr:hypothetical protein [Candidatus Binatia bacterium]